MKILVYAFFFKSLCLQHISLAVEFTNCSQVVCLLIKSKLAIILEEFCTLYNLKFCFLLRKLFEISFSVVYYFQKYAIHSSDLPNGTSKEQEEQQKKKKGIFSKGKKMFKKAFR